MAILKMEKFNLIIFEDDKQKVLNTLQNFREVDFRETQLEEFGYANYISKDFEDIDDKIYKLDQTIRNLRKYSVSKGAIKSLKEGQKTYTYKELKDFVSNSNWVSLSKEILDLQFSYDTNLKNIENAKSKILEYTPLIKFDVKEKDYSSLKSVIIDLGLVSARSIEDFKKELETLGSYYEIINETSKDVLIAIITKENLKEEYFEITRKYNFNKHSIELKKKPEEYISDYKQEIETLVNENKKIIDIFKEYTSKIEDLEVCYEYFKNEKLRETVTEKFAKTDKLSVITGYIPSERKDKFYEMLNDTCHTNYYVSFEEAQKDSLDVPIKLENKGFNGAFEGLVKTYSLPKYNEIDPTPLVAPFYWLFFGMMVADFGYGFIVSLLSFIVLKTCNIKESVRKNVKFFFYLGFSIMLWGIIYGSYFSTPIGIPGLINPAVDYNTILLISIIIGFIHIFFALGVKAYILIRDGKPMDAVYDVGLWYILLSTIILLLAGSKLGLSAGAMKITKYLMYASMIGIVLTGAREVKNIGGRIGLGVYALYGVSGYMGDLVSYARLMALGLSGGFIAQSVNQICGMIGFKPLSMIFVIIIFALGQTFNLLLSLLGAYVHSARLIYVEFFGKFYEGGGKEFKDFKIEEKYINIKEDK